jgi:hypothetical protein
MAHMDGCLWIAGGQYDDAVSSSVEVYDIASNSWLPCTPMYSQRMWFRLLVIENNLYAVGGDVDDRGTSIRPSIERFNKTMRRWEYVASFPMLRRVYSATAVGTEIYVFGGRDVNFATLQDWDKYNLKTRKWDSDLAREHKENNEFSTNNVFDNFYKSKHMEKKNNEKSEDVASTKRLIPRSKFYGGQAISVPAVDITW